MDKSQLRRLALEFANGDVDHESYVRERTELIDQIVAGQIGIEREAPAPIRKPRQPDDPPPPEDTVQMEAVVPPPASRLNPVHIVIGGIVIAVIAAFALSGGDDEVPPPPPAPVVDTTPAPAPVEEPEAKRLIETFLAANYWGEDGLDQFTASWTGLTMPQREEARSAPWFRPLTTALKQEINAQRALAGLDSGESTRIKGRRLVAFAKTLGVAGPFPSFEPDGTAEPPVASPSRSESTDASESAAMTTATSAVEPQPTSAADDTNTAAGQSAAAASRTGASDTEAAQDTTPTPVAETTSSAAASTGTEAAPASTPTVPNTDPWLDSLADEAYALQLFAVRKLDEVRKLIEANAGQDLHVIQAPAEDGPLYRVVTGPFPDEAAARAAFARLPDTLKRGQTEPLVRRVASLRGKRAAVVPDASPGSGTRSVAANTATAPRPPATGGSTVTADGYTLQLFMSQARENLERVVEQYPELALRIHGDGRPSPTYRILFGDFPSADAAKAAAAALPESLLASINGPPLVKDSQEPDGAVITIATRP